MKSLHFIYKTPLNNATEKGNIDIVKLFLSSEKIDVNLANKIQNIKIQ